MTTPPSISAPMQTDLVVIGSGAAGLTAAVTAASLGLTVVVLEKHHQIGGTTAWSGGWLWVPRNPLAVAAGIVEDIEAPRNYLKAELGDGYDEAVATMYLEQSPRMVDFLRRETAVDFVDGNIIPDFHDISPGAGHGGRSVCAAPYDGRKLGKRINDLRPPLEDISPLGMGIASGADLRHFINATSALASFAHVTQRVARHVLDVLRYGRGMHLVNGNALVARLLQSADDLGVTILTSTAAECTRVENGAVRGVTARAADGRRFDIHASRGTILAAGGFPHDPARIADLFPHAPTGREHWSAAPPENTGDGLRLGESAGGHVRRDLTNAGAWAPISLTPRSGGASGRFPHLVERAKPGLIIVLPDGRRFANEADSYHDLMQALFAATRRGQQPRAWMICDHAFQRRYGLGRSRPRPFPLGHWLRNGYLRRAPTIAALAAACDIDPAALGATVTAFNAHAVEGRDPQFGRGTSAYNRIQGEPRHMPNPCVGPIVKAPFYAVEIVPGSLGTFAGLRTDQRARVLGENASPIPGLYAVGNDMASMMAGRYPAGGITLGPAMTFAYIAAHDASGIPLDNNRT